MRTEARRRLYTSDDEVMTDVRTRCLTVCTRWAGYTQAAAAAAALAGWPDSRLTRALPRAPSVTRYVTAAVVGG